MCISALPEAFVTVLNGVAGAGDGPFHYLACEHHTRPTGFGGSGMLSDYIPDLITPCKYDPDLRSMARLILKQSSQKAAWSAAELNRSGRCVHASYFDLL